MKIGDRDSFVETAEYELLDDVTVTINGLPLGFDEQMEDDIPSPVAPQIPVRNKDGHFVYKNKQKKICETEPDENDPKYKAESRAANRCQAAWIVYNGTSQDTKLKWAAQVESFGSPYDFYDAIYKEMVSSGIGAGKILQLTLAIQALSGMSQAQIDRAKEVFLSGEASEN
jgi:hypothetical protein